MRYLIVLFSTLLASCATSGVPSAITATASQESALLLQHRRVARRTGSLLTVLRGGTSVPERYVSTDCAKTDDCATYTLDAAWHGGLLLGIDVGLYEGSSYIVADTRGDHVVTGYRPDLAPDGRHFATAAFSEAHENGMEGVRIYAVRDASVLVRSISPTAMAYTDHGAWQGDSCFSFTAPEGGHIYTSAGLPAPLVTWYLVEAAPEWRLTRDRGPACTE